MSGNEIYTHWLEKLALAESGRRRIAEAEGDEERELLHLRNIEALTTALEALKEQAKQQLLPRQTGWGGG